MHDTLLLNADYAPIRVLSWQRAVCLLLEDRVRMIAPYPDRVLRSPSAELPWPAVVALASYVRLPYRVKLQRSTVFARDRHTCQYCGLRPRTELGRPDLAALTIDHVVPRSRARGGVVTTVDGRRVGVSSWHNVVAACAPCNRRKGSRTPDEARMALARPPGAPSARDAVRIALAKSAVPPEWSDFLVR